MADIIKYGKFLNDLEGGFSNRKSDRGGPTYRGVTLKTFRNFYGQHMTVKDLQNMTDEQWWHILRVGYWNKCKGDEIISQSVAEIFVDWMYNSGFVAIQKVQNILGVKPDGVVGPITLKAINAQDPETLFRKIYEMRFNFFHQIVRNDKTNTQKDNLEGWLNRLSKFIYQE